MNIYSSLKAVYKIAVAGSLIAISSFGFSADVERDFAGRQVVFSDISVNQTGVNTATVEAGAMVTVSTNWTSTFVSDYCPGCIQQLYIGVKDTAIDCMYSGNTSSNRAGAGNLSFVAPKQPGVYAIQAASSLQFSCTTTQEQMSNSVEGALGYIRVVESNDTVSRSFAGRNVAFTNIDLNNTGTNNIRVIPGENVNVKVDWNSEFVSDYCPGCIQQFYIGVKDLAVDCMYSGNTSSARMGDGEFNFVAPTEPGVYVVQATDSLQFSCTKTEADLSTSTDGAIASIEVVAP